MDGTYPKGSPRSVADPDAAAHEEMLRRHKLELADREAALAAAKRTIDGRTAAIVDVLGSARRARTEWEKGNRTQALVNALTGSADLASGGALVRGLIGRQFKIDGPHAWRTKPWEEPGMRQWMGKRGLLNKGQHGHHGIIPNNGWGKLVPDVIKNQPWNIKGMESPEVHGRTHGTYKGKPRYGPVERYLKGTPNWWKASNVSVLLHGQALLRDEIGETP